MKRQNRSRVIVLLAVFCLAWATAWAQQRLLTFSVTEFYEDQQATTATSDEFGKRDGNGAYMAIIKVQSARADVALSDLDKFTFDFGNMKHEVRVRGDELWVYVQRNAKRMTIRREGYAPIKNMDLKTTVQAGKTYVLKLTFDKVIQNIVYSVKKQIVQFKVDPAMKGTLIKLTREGEREPLEALETDDDGTVAQNFDFGTYFYEVTAADYQTSMGRIKLTTSEETHVENVILTPNFGYLVLNDPDNAGGAQVFVDGKEVGTVPYSRKDRWNEGVHTLLLKKENYKPYTATFTITKGETTTLAPHLESNAAETTLTVEGGADIYIDNKRVGAGRWAGMLKAGSHVVECRKQNHRPTTRPIEVQPDQESTIELEPPTPITGALAVISRPNGAQITIDGKAAGITPRNIGDLLIGQHKVEVSMPGRKTVSRTVTIEEGKQETVNIELASIADVSFTGNPTGSRVTIDGQEAGNTPFTKEMGSGTYHVKATKSGYKTYDKRIYIDVSKPSVHLKLKEQLMKRNAFYMEAVAQFGNFNGFGGTMGFFAGNINVEGSCLMGFGKEDIFWCASGAVEEQLKPQAETLKAKMSAGGRMGYGFIIGTRFRMTPQLGVNCIRVKGDETDVHALSGTAGLRLEFALMKRLALSVTPEYAIKLSESDGYKTISTVSNTLKNWVEGFSCKVGLKFL